MKIKLFLPVLALAGLMACAAPYSSTVDLTASEKAQAIKLAERRQDTNFREQQENARHVAAVDRLSEENQQIQIDAQILCFNLKKLHKLDNDVNYVLDEWKGVLIKK